MYRDAGGGGTSTLTLNGGPGEDLVVEAGAALRIIAPSGSAGSMRFTIGSSVDQMRVSGTLSMITNQQMSFRNGTSGAAGVFRFKSGSTCITNILSGSSSYGFGNSTQSSGGWVLFESGSHLYYQGGDSPEGSGSGFSAIVFQPGSIWHHRTSNATERGNFFDRQSYGDIIVENNATLTASGSVYRIGNLTVNNGCSFVPNSSGQTVVLGNLIVNGAYTSSMGETNRLVLAGSAAPSLSGTGSIALANLTIADKAIVTLNKNIAVETDIDVYGKLNFVTNQLSGTSTFNAFGPAAATSGSGNLVAGNYFITGNTTFSSSSIGKNISGTGIAPNTSIVSISTTSDSMFLSQPLLTTGTAVALSALSGGATLQSANANGFDPASGSVVTSGNSFFEDNINYILDAATTTPFGVTTGSSGNMINAGSVDVNAAITVNKGVTIKNNLLISGKMTLRPADLVHILAGADITGTFSATKYIATDYNTGTGLQSIVQYDGIATSKTIPIGTINYYLPVTINPSSVCDFSAAVFAGITINGTLTGTAFTATQKLRVVDAVWNINRTNGSGAADLQLTWDEALEGSTFTTLPDASIGLIANNGTTWAPPIGTANNSTNSTLPTTVSSFGSFGIGAIPQVNPFVFNPLPDKTYGDADFNGGATSLNTDKPIIYTSSNTAVATIVNGDIHITGAGTTNITATQESDGFYPAANVTQSLLVNKGALTIKADNKTRFEGLANPPLTITYTGFVSGETATALLTQAVITTTAVPASAPGTYPITVTGATSNNYAITFVNAVLTVQAKQNQVITFNAPATKTYGNADFPANATSTNTTIPVVLTSSNTSVATIVGNNIHITGAGISTITAAQAGNDGYFPATSVVRTLTVNKVNLALKVSDTTKTTGQPNPVFTVAYTGFVLGQTVANLTTPPTITTTATTLSSPGNYAVTPASAVTQNYNITYTAGRLTVLPSTGTSTLYLNAFRNSNGNITVRVYSPEPRLGDIIVYDLNGRIMARKNILMPVGFANVEILTPLLSSGLYVVTVRGTDVKLEKMIQFLK